MRNTRAFKNILLVNPWIYDFAAYDLWIKPLGLLYVAASLRRNGYGIQLIDCLDRNHPAMRVMEKPGDRKPDGRGNFHREIVEKPPELEWVPRHFSRYGYPLDLFQQELNSIEPPDAVLITSMMTYWYRGTEKAAAMVKAQFPEVPVILGGVYATLCPEHARQRPHVDHVIAGYGEEAAVSWLDDYFGISQQVVPEDAAGDPEVPWDLYPDLSSLIVLTARGCPYNCSFCATTQLNEKFLQRKPAGVAEEILRLTDSRSVQDVVFYDDALFVKKRSHIENILNQVNDRSDRLRFHTPNGLFAGMIDEQLAATLVRSNFETVRLSFETSNEGRRGDMNYKVTNQEFLKALDHLEYAGFPRSRVEVYTLMGLPGQSLEEITRSVEFVHAAGAKVSLTSFTPIPGTLDYQRAAESGGMAPDTDPLLLNNTIYSLQNSELSYDTFNQIRSYAKQLNQKLTES